MKGRIQQRNSWTRFRMTGCLLLGVLATTALMSSLAFSSSPQKVDRTISLLPRSSLQKMAFVQPAVIGTIGRDVQVRDAVQVWTIQSDLPIFSSRYSNEKQAVTVDSSRQDHVIAPGTSGTYVFVLTNTGPDAISYRMAGSAEQRGTDGQIPVVVRLRDDRNQWYAGTADQWVSTDRLNDVSCEQTVPAYGQSVFTLDWNWPFESEQDEWDTQLGLQAGQNDLSLTLHLEIEAQYAQESENQTGGDYGDQSSSVIRNESNESKDQSRIVTAAVHTGLLVRKYWLVLLVLSLAVFFMVMAEKEGE